MYGLRVVPACAAKMYPAPFSIDRFTRLGKTSVGRAWFPALRAQSVGIRRISRNLSPQEARAALRGGLRSKCHEPTPDGSNGDPGLLGSVAPRSFSRSWSTSWVRGVIGLYLPQKKRPTLRANDSCCCFGFVHAVPEVDMECYLVDPASSHMLVSKIKPCMCKYELIQTVKLRMAH